MKNIFRLDHQQRRLAVYSVATAVILTLSFPPFPLGIFACIGFVPFLFAVESIERVGSFLRFAYGTFFLWSLGSLYWVGGFTHGQDPYLMIAGTALMFWEPLVFTLPALLYFIVRRTFRHTLSLFAFPFIWVTMEWLYAYGELAFPWLHMGNTQTYQLEKIQFADITGVYGISLWVLVLNVLFFLLIRSIVSGTSLRHSLAIAGTVIALYIAPNFYRADEEALHRTSGKGITVGIIQPNINPWDKWEGANSFSGRWSQVQHYMELMRRHHNDSLQVVLLPESAILLNLPQFPEYMNILKQHADALNVSVVSGYVRVRYYDAASAPLTANILRETDMRYDSFNSILYIQPGSDSVQSYSKMRLVPFAERIPYAESVPFLIEPLRWGVGISNWGLERDSTIFSDSRTGSSFLAMVCYESIFPEFVSRFVQKGAHYLIFTTNDSWWGNTSGARQHNQFAILRAVENRRWVARCANGGISSFIDPSGRMYDATDMYQEAFIQRTIYPRTELTFYSQHGDWLARICASIVLGICLFLIGYKIYMKVRSL